MSIGINGIDGIAGVCAGGGTEGQNEEGSDEGASSGHSGF